MIIYVGAFGSRHAVEVHAWTKIKHLKRKIVSMGISERAPPLEHRGRRLDDEKTIFHYGIKDGDTVRFLQPRSVPCFGRGSSQSVTTFGCRGSLLTVARNSGSVTKMVVHEDGSVRQVKEEAARDAGVSASKVQLIAGGVEMQDDRRLKDYGLTGDGVVWMEVEGEEEGREGGSQSRDGRL
ncbi:uncharacterized protein LOC119581206 [Penaeus monodon]|uniref:uncharacterized protein LOC119581206 n=1 Tax=Penaeus monodon TaxID=6687 RepID=UPI0018A7C9B7|nr:uncharacterized protein LOC119581206 [Penaeus monodon]XP_037785536.1 uncharacterized protein LOC119581206 [Penaeus monodon]